MEFRYVRVYCKIIAQSCIYSIISCLISCLLEQDFGHIRDANLVLWHPKWHQWMTWGRQDPKMWCQNLILILTLMPSCMGIALTEYTLRHFPSSSVVYGAKIDIGATLFSPTRKKFST